MLDQLFMSVIDMSKTASIVILFVLAARLLLKKMPKSISYFLWIVVLFRLLCPFSFESIISFIPAMNPTSYTSQPSEEDKAYAIGAGETVLHTAKDLFQNEEDAYKLEGSITIDQKGNLKDSTPAYYVISLILGQYLWIAGIVFMLLYSIYTFVKLKEKVITAIRYQDNIYYVDNIISPFVLGFIRPRIYLPYSLNEKEQRYILLHEQTHIKRYDYVLKLIAYIALCIHWFNPLVWFAFNEFSKDLEMSCDEAVIQTMGEDIRADYASSLLSLATEDRIIQGTPLAFGEGDTKDRIINISMIKKNSAKKMRIIGILSVIFTLCLSANPKRIDSDLIKEKNTTVRNEYIQYLECNQYGINAAYGVFEIINDKLTATNATNNFGQLGLNWIDESHIRYKNITIAENVKHFDYNTFTLIYLTKDNQLYGMGSNSFGQLGQPIKEQYVGHVTSDVESCMITPTLIMTDVKYAVLGYGHMLILKNDNSLWGIGSNEYNELGIGKEEDIRYYSEPQKIMDNVLYIAAKDHNSAAINKKQQLYVWGDNRHGQIARDGRTSNAAMPEVVMYSASSVYFYKNADGNLHWKANEPPTEIDKQQHDKKTSTTYTPESEEILVYPSKEDVLEKRKLALEGMTDQQIKRLTENVKVYNLKFEHAYMYGNIFEKLEDKESHYWGYFDQTDDFQAISEEDGETIITIDNPYNYLSFVAIFEEMKDTVHNKSFKADIQKLIDEVKQAAGTHEMEHANNIFKILHDMDYFLLRYGIEDVGQYTENDGILHKYYNTLSIHKE